MEHREFNDLIYSKIILFGEYSMILDSKALMIPFRRFAAQWCYGTPDNEAVVNSQKSILSIADYIEKDDELSELIDTNGIKADIKQGLYLRSDIPLGYGLGSSGALVAALWQCYAKSQIADFMELKRVFGRMESFFHGSSSGIDPLQCYIGRPFMISGEGVSILPDDFISPDIKIGLADTRTKSPTGPLVRHFKEILCDKAYHDRFSGEYLPCMARCFDTVGEGGRAFFESLKRLSQLQAGLFGPMLTPSTRHLFTTEFGFNFGAKILGSGGGGFVLFFTDDTRLASNLLSDFDVIWL